MVAAAAAARAAGLVLSARAAPPRSHFAPPLALSSAVTCQMQQKTGSALITACAQYWDKATDGFASMKWESEAVQVLVTVYGVAV